MGFKLCSLEMVVRDGATTPTPSVGLPALLAAFASTWLVPRHILVWGDPSQGPAATTRFDPRAAVGDQRLWVDEEAAPDAIVTRCRDPRDLGTIDELASVLAASQCADLEVSVLGAIAVIEPGSSAPAWLGRWRFYEPDGLWKLVTLRLVWRHDSRRVRIELELSGYPLTPVVPTASGVDDGDERVAWRNRRHLIPAISQASSALGLAADQVVWRLDGDFRSLYPTAADALERWWMPALASGKCDANTEPEPVDPSAARPRIPPSSADAATWLDYLAGSPEERAVALRVLAGEPSHDPAVLDAITSLLYDDAPAVLQVPLRFGPIGLLAARARAAELRAAGANDNVRFRSTPPVTATHIVAYEARAGLPPIEQRYDPSQPHRVMLARYTRLCELGVLQPDEYVIDAATSLDDLTPPPVELPNAPAPVPPTGEASAPTSHAASVLQRLLDGGEPRIWALEDLAHEPIDEPAVVAAVGAALGDRTPCMLDGAYVGEVRLLAAVALAALRAVALDITPLRARFVPPTSLGYLLTLMESITDPDAPPSSDPLACFAWLCTRGVLREVEHTLRHPVDMAALAVTD